MSGGRTGWSGPAWVGAKPGRQRSERFGLADLAAIVPLLKRILALRIAGNRRGCPGACGA
ncbi:MAG TPA: hypothetical protein P5572_15865 [Phycisphaerae bacterium]|nr:hypothetical protein [Phycisphaerales bacterium]HRX86499.1 hypothetical protein [Phycisphaerae bacterium]